MYEGKRPGTIRLRFYYRYPGTISIVGTGPQRCLSIRTIFVVFLPRNVFMHVILSYVIHILYIYTHESLRIKNTGTFWFSILKSPPPPAAAITFRWIAVRSQTAHAIDRPQRFPCNSVKRFSYGRPLVKVSSRTSFSTHGHSRYRCRTCV